MLDDRAHHQGERRRAQSLWRCATTTRLRRSRRIGGILFPDSARTAVLIAVVAVPINVTASCGFTKAFQQPDEGGSQRVQVFRGDPVPALQGARPLLFVASLKVNTDGTKISYHQRDVTGRWCMNNTGAGPCALNNIRNAFRNPKRPEADFESVRDVGYPVDQV